MELRHLHSYKVDYSTYSFVLEQILNSLLFVPSLYSHLIREGVTSLNEIL